MSIELYEKYGSLGDIVIVDNVNWSNSFDPTLPYHENPIMRPSEEEDQTCSYTKFNYFRVRDFTRAKNVEIVLLSPYSVKATGTIQDGVVTIGYGGANISGDIRDIKTHTVIGSVIAIDEFGEAKTVDVLPAFKTGYYEFETVLGLDPLGSSDSAKYPKRVDKTRLYYKILSYYVPQINTHDWNMIYAGIGNKHITVPLLQNPEYSYSTISNSYTGIDLYTPYIVTQLRTNASTWDDVGNSPPWQIGFRAQLFK